jgi:hypothetical protein
MPAVVLQGWRRRCIPVLSALEAPVESRSTARENAEETVITIAPNLVVAGDPGLAWKLWNTGLFPSVFDVASATGLRDLSKRGRVRYPAAFMFGPEFNEDIPGTEVRLLADRLVASGFTVIVHAFFTGRGDVFDSRVATTSEPMSMAGLLATLGVTPPGRQPGPPESWLAQPPDLYPEPPPDPWAAPGTLPESPTGESHAAHQ